MLQRKERMLIVRKTTVSFPFLFQFKFKAGAQLGVGMPSLRRLAPPLDGGPEVLNRGPYSSIYISNFLENLK